MLMAYDLISYCLSKIPGVHSSRTLKNKTLAMGITQVGIQLTISKMQKPTENLY